LDKITYKTIKKNSEFEINKIKGSRFIGSIFRVSSKNEAEKELEAIRKKNYNATHNCFAYIVNAKQGVVTRYSDDGEPSGSAGRPIMNVVESNNLTNVLVVVTRYYGGTKLGTGGLARAYSEATKEVIAHSNIIDIEIKKKLEFSYDYDQTSMVMNLVNKYEANIIEENYGNNASMSIKINKAFIQTFTDEIFDKSNGKIKTKGIEK